MARLSAMDALDRKGARDSPDELPDDAGKHNRIDEPHPTFAWDREVKREHAPAPDPRLKVMWGATVCSPLGREAAAMSAWRADQCSELLTREQPLAEEKVHAATVRAARGRELAARSQFDGLPPRKGGAAS